MSDKTPEAMQKAWQNSASKAYRAHDHFDEEWHRIQRLRDATRNDGPEDMAAPAWYRRAWQWTRGFWLWRR